MHNYFKSFGYALEGLRAAFTTERNLKFFGCVYVCSLLLGWFFAIGARNWEMVIFTGGLFFSVELINTALEHFADAFDDHTKSQNDHKTAAIKATKDIAAAASLVCALAWAMVLIIIFLPYVMTFLGWSNL